MKPTLPEPDIYATSGPAHNYGIEKGYTAEVVQRLIDEAYAAGLEDAEKCCKEIQRRHDGRANKAIIARNQEDQIYFEGCMVGAEDCAEAIQALKETP